MRGRRSYGQVKRFVIGGELVNPVETSVLSVSIFFMPMILRSAYAFVRMISSWWKPWYILGVSPLADMTTLL